MSENENMTTLLCYLIRKANTMGGHAHLLPRTSNFILENLTEKWMNTRRMCEISRQ